tara:strand:+ start:681 stop:2003 length:1323 start_codon:yes stop_codon:yes gene_type:complete
VELLKEKKMIKLKLFGDRRISIIQVPLDTTADGEDLYYQVAIVQPSGENSLAQIPKGVNPRDVAPSTSLFKDIVKSYLEGNMFLVYNGGMTATIDTGSFTTLTEPDGDYILFSCDNTDNGHYDGQHSEGAVRYAIEEDDKGGDNPPFMLILIDDGLLPDRKSRRDAATRTNNRSSQKTNSEMDIRGFFDDIKAEIAYCPVENIEWKQNQLNSKGEALKADCKATQLINMLGAFLPLALVHGGELENICTWPKKGEASLHNILNDSLSIPLNAAYKNVDFVLEMADFVRSSSGEILGTKLDRFGITKMSTAAQRKKAIADRKPLKTQLFSGEFVEHGFNKDVLPIIMYALVDSVFEFDESTGSYNTEFTIEEIKAMWIEGGYAVLKTIEGSFANCFEDKYKSRWADFVLDTLMWKRAAKEFSKTVARPRDWKDHLTHTLVK